MPANVLLKHRVIVTAGFANDVDAVNQYAAVMYAPTANGTAVGFSRDEPQMTHIKPNVAMNSLNICDGPDRACVDNETTDKPNIRCAAIAPAIPPRTWLNT